MVWAPEVRVEYPMKGAEVSQPDRSKNEAADRRSEETRSFVRTVKAATRRKYTLKRRSASCWKASAARSL